MKHFIVFVFFISSICLGQSLDDFTRLKSGGIVPSDFLMLSSEKFYKDYESNTDPALKRDFFLNTRFFIDDLLLSGMVLFNEPLSDYLNKVANHVLANYSDIRQKLRFYVLKSNVANAFSTDQGIIFFTTGLMARLENEAQLAFVLAHEISHFTLKHIRKSYAQQESMNNEYYGVSYEERLQRLSQYSQKSEFEADRFGGVIFLNAGYSGKEMNSTIDILRSAELPFEDKKFDITWFNTDQLYIPKSFFPDTIQKWSPTKMKVEGLQTHPGLDERAFELHYLIGENDTSTKQYIVSEQEFMMVRDMARFESVNLHLAHREYGQALYLIYLLEEKHAENIFLEKCKLKALYGLVKYKNSNRFEEVCPKGNEIFGESYTLHVFLRTISREQLNVIGLRYCTDLVKKYPRDEVIKLYRNDLLKEFALNSNIRRQDLKEFTFLAAMEAIIDKNGLPNSDTLNQPWKSDSLKSRDLTVQNEQSLILDSLLINEADFHLYGLSDLLNEGLLADLEKIEKSHSVDEGKIMYSTSRLEYFVEDGDTTPIGKLFIVSPQLTMYDKYGNRKYLKEEKKGIAINEMYADPSKKTEVDLVLADSKNLSDTSVEIYNQIGLLRQWSNEIVHHGKLEMISSFYEDVQLISDTVGTNHFYFSDITTEENKHYFTSLHLAGLFFLPFYPFVFYDLLSKHSRMDFITYSINTETERLEYKYILYNAHICNNKRIGRHINRIYKELSTNGK